MGGMQALAFAALYPGLFPRVAALCTTAHTSPSTVATRAVQRAAIRGDPRWEHGAYRADQGPETGMRLARMVGTMAYRSRAEFDEKFHWRADDTGRHDVEYYLDHQAGGFTSRYDANCYLCLSQAMDDMDISDITGSYESSVVRIGAEGKTECLLLAVRQDALIPYEQMERVGSILGHHGVLVHYEMISSLQGHDAFLTDMASFGPRMGSFLHGGIEGVRKYTASIEMM
jgi:homoserine O-acetyltransferase